MRCRICSKELRGLNSVYIEDYFVCCEECYKSFNFKVCSTCRGEGCADCNGLGYYSFEALNEKIIRLEREIEKEQMKMLLIKNKLKELKGE